MVATGNMPGKVSRVASFVAALLTSLACAQFHTKNPILARELVGDKLLEVLFWFFVCLRSFLLGSIMSGGAIDSCRGA